MGALAKAVEGLVTLPQPEYKLPKLDMPVEVIDNPVTVEEMQAFQNSLFENTRVVRYDQNKVTGHQYCDGLYSRQYFLPAGNVAVSLMHKKENFFLLVQGECMVWGPDGQVRIRAPFMQTTLPGAKRVIHALEDCVFVTFHPNPDNETDLKKLEDRFIIPELGVKRDMSIRVAHEEVET
jgi:hypothetical protein